MRIMIVGDSASGKSHFSRRIGEELNHPVLHVDEIAFAVGRDNRQAIGDIIRAEIVKPSWIIDGNAFTKDLTGRLEAADIVFIFDFNRFHALYNNIVRYVKVKSGKQDLVGNNNEQLGIWYFIPYMLWRFPPRKQRAIKKAKELNKKLVIFTSRKQATEYRLS